MGDGVTFIVIFTYPKRRRDQFDFVSAYLSLFICLISLLPNLLVYIYIYIIFTFFFYINILVIIY